MRSWSRREASEKAILRSAEVGKEYIELPSDDFYFLHKIGSQGFMKHSGEERSRLNWSDSFVGWNSEGISSPS